MCVDTPTTALFHHHHSVTDRWSSWSRTLPELAIIVGKRRPLVYNHTIVLKNNLVQCLRIDTMFDSYLSVSLSTSTTYYVKLYYPTYYRIIIVKVKHLKCNWMSKPHRTNFVDHHVYVHDSVHERIQWTMSPINWCHPCLLI